MVYDYGYSGKTSTEPSAKIFILNTPCIYLKRNMTIETIKRMNYE